MIKYFISFILFFWLLSFVNADCIDFDEWKLCLNLENTWNWNYKVNKNFDNNSSNNIFLLSCSILTPSWILKELWACDWSFEYNWTWINDIRYYVDFQDQRKILNTKANFVYFKYRQWQEFIWVYSMWQDLVDKLWNKFPKLANNQEWINISNNLYKQMDNLVNTEKSTIDSYQNFYDLIVDYVRYSISKK